MNKTIIGEYRRISKQAAEKLYNAGQTIRLCACKLSPVNVWGAFVDVSNASQNQAFEAVINAFSYYNCSHETGYYPAFYVKEV